MILDVPDMFVEVLRRLEGLTPRRTVDCLGGPQAILRKRRKSLGNGGR